MQRVNLELQQLRLLLGQPAQPLVPVELLGDGWRAGSGGADSDLGLPEKGRDAGIGFGFLDVASGELGCFALERVGAAAAAAHPV